MFPEHMFTVQAAIELGREEEFERWYQEEHLPEAAQLPGCVGAARYRVRAGDVSHQHMAMYAFESEAQLNAALESDHFRELVWRFDEAVGAFSTRTRGLYIRVQALGGHDA